MKIILAGGFLGAGKTTFIRQLAEFLIIREGKKVVIIENEAGEVSIDDKLLSQDGFQVKEIFGGCICCQLTSELTVAISQIKQQFNPGWIIIEPTGLANITPVLDTLKKYGKGFKSVYTIVLVDAERWWELSEIMPDFVSSQVAAADLVLVNKIDAVSEEDLKRIVPKVKEINPNACCELISAINGVDEKLLRGLCQNESSSTPSNT